MLKDQKKKVLNHVLNNSAEELNFEEPSFEELNSEIHTFKELRNRLQALGVRLQKNLSRRTQL